MENIIAENVILGNNVLIGENVVIKHGCIIEDNVIIKDNVYIDCGTIIHSNVTIGENTVIGCRCTLGEYLADFYIDNRQSRHSLYIGRNSLIRSETIIYSENMLGEALQTGHRVTIREHSKIGDHVRIGTLTDIQGHCEIQDYVNIHSNVHIGQKSVVKKYAWLFPYVILTNDPNPPSENLLGVTIEEFAVVSTGTVILPGVVIGEAALVGAGAVVTKNVDRSMVVIGNPARPRCSTDEIINDVTGEKVYPWRNTFDRGMPWQNIGYQKWMDMKKCDE